MNEVNDVTEVSKYQRVYADLVTRAIYDALSDGRWHSRRDIVAKVAPKVPAAKAYRWKAKKGSPELAGTEKAVKVASGQRAYASNRVMIQTRRSRNVEIHPDDHDQIRLNPVVAAEWQSYVDSVDRTPTSEEGED